MSITEYHVVWTWWERHSSTKGHFETCWLSNYKKGRCQIPVGLIFCYLMQCHFKIVFWTHWKTTLSRQLNKSSHAGQLITSRWQNNHSCLKWCFVWYTFCKTGLLPNSMWSPLCTCRTVKLHYNFLMWFPLCQGTV